MRGNETIAGVGFERLIGGHEAVIFTRNVRIDSETTVERGALLAGSFDGTATAVHLATASDANGKEIFIAAESSEYAPVNEGYRIVTVYTSGVFNRGGIKVSEGVKLETFEEEMRRQGIILTSEVGGASDD